MKFLDLFAGIGGFRLGMEMAGHECVGWVETDPKCEKCKKFTKHIPSTKRNFTICTVCGKEKRQHARFSYEAIHNTEGEWTANDITTVSTESIRRIGNIDVICGGFPCQAFSIAGKRKDTRGTLFFEIMRFASILKPRYLFLENVKGLLNHENGDTFETILRTMDEVGYDVEWDLLDSKNFGVPQKRERIFIIGHLRGAGRRKIFPIEGTNGEASIPIKLVAHRKGYHRNTQTFAPDGITETLDTGQGGGRGHYTIVKPVLTPDREEKRQNGRRFKEDGEPMFTLTAQDRHGILINEGSVKKSEKVNCIDANYYKGLDNHGQRTGIKDGFRIRKLTPRECWRLQGFPDWAFDKAATVNSDSQLYNQAGNSVTVNVIYEIAKRL